MAVCTSAKASTSTRRARFSDTSMRRVGKKMLTVPSLLTASSATATAAANRPRIQSTTRMLAAPYLALPAAPSAASESSMRGTSHCVTSLRSWPMVAVVCCTWREAGSK